MSRSGECTCEIHCNRGCNPECIPCNKPGSRALSAPVTFLTKTIELEKNYSVNLGHAVPVTQEEAWVGVDPGKSGALAVISKSEEVLIFETPVVSVGKKKDYDLDEIKNIIRSVKRKYRLKTAVELVHAMPGQGVTSMFSMGYGLGIWRMALVALDVPHEMVTPQAWKKLLMAGQPKDKQASVLVASQIYPHASPLLYGKKGGKKDGNADALLIAEWLKRMRP